MLTLNTLVKNFVDLELKGPDGEPLVDENGNEVKVTLKVQGTNVQSIKVKAIEANGYLMSAGKTEDPKKIAKAIIDAESALAAMAAEAVIGWDNDEFMCGAYTPQYAKELLARPELDFIRKQVSECIGDQQRWFSQNKKSSE